MGRIKDIDVELHELPDFEKGVRAERERIIKLLEDEQWHDMVFAKEVVVNGEVYHGWRKNHSMTCNGCKLIALIKGENK